MGYKVTEDIVNAPLSIEDKLSWHLVGNHYPPVDEAFIPVCIEAIDHARMGNWDTVLEYPNGLQRTVRHCIDGLHLELFVDG